jgi:glycosyltransferase involved in cell wall biosynthesis
MDGGDAPRPTDADDDVATARDDGVDDVPRPTRGRIVMLVDNGVRGDSRVQKAARSAAAAGWDVTLLGCTGSADRDASTGALWRLGRATVRVLPLAGASGPSRTIGAPTERLRAGLLARGGLALRMARLARRPVEHMQVWFWRAAHGDRSWRRLEPGLWNYERTFGPVIDDVMPDIIHAHDFRMLGVGARAAMRARAAGREVSLVWDAHEFLPGVRPGRNNARWLPAHRAYEREYAPCADAVVTVSATLADLLQREHSLDRRPAVVLNAPVLNAPVLNRPTDLATEPPADLRRLCGLDAGQSLLVYAGSASAQRGLDTVVRALPRLPGVHAALVLPDPDAPYAARLTAIAGHLGVGDRLHVLPYVPYEDVVVFLSAADVGVIPIHHWPNHELALITKFFEYSHARLPIVVSDVKTMAETVRATGQGEVFRARDVADFVRAVAAVLADPRRYRAAYDRPDSLLSTWTWDAQAEPLTSIYQDLVPDRPPIGASRR